MKKNIFSSIAPMQTDYCTFMKLSPFHILQEQRKYLNYSPDSRIKYHAHLPLSPKTPSFKHLPLKK